MAKGSSNDDLVGFDVGADEAPPEGAFQQAPAMDAAPVAPSMHHDVAAPEPALPKKRHRRSALPVPTIERSEAGDEPELVTDALRASARANGPQSLGPVLIVVGLVVMTCSGVGLAGAGLWFLTGDDVTEAAPEPEEPDEPTRTGSRGEIPVEKGLRRGAPAPSPQPGRPDVPNPNE